MTEQQRADFERANARFHARAAAEAAETAAKQLRYGLDHRPADGMPAVHHEAWAKQVAANRSPEPSHTSRVP